MMTMYSQAGKTDPQNCSFKVDGLFSGHSYLVRVAAENQRGRGAFVETGPVTARLPYGEWGEGGTRLMCLVRRAYISK